jgi:hypothetical protein
MLIGEALQALGYKNGFYVIGDTFEGIHWVDELEKKPTKKQVMDMVEKLPELKKVQQLAKQDARASALTKLGEIAGLTKEELDAIL